MTSFFCRCASGIVFLLLPAFFPFFLPDAACARFVDNGNGTITDTATGYMWQKRAPDRQYTFDGARTYAGRLTLAGYRDWRVPDRDALLSIVDSGRRPAVVSGYFENTRTDGYWTSTTADPVSSPDYACVVTFDTGLDLQRHKGDNFYVRVVRDAPGDYYPDDDDDPRAYVTCFVGALSGAGPRTEPLRAKAQNRFDGCGAANAPLPLYTP